MAASESIELERVVFIEKIDVPGAQIDGDWSYPTKEKILVSAANPNKRVTQSQKFLLTFKPAEGVVIIEHPETHRREYVPISNVAQFRVAPPKATEPKAPVK